MSSCDGGGGHDEAWSGCGDGTGITDRGGGTGICDCGIGDAEDWSSCNDGVNGGTDSCDGGAW